LVCSAARRQLGDPHLADEVTPAVFIILSQKAGRIGDATVLSGWLFKTTRFVALAQTRAAVRRHRYEQESVMQSEAHPTPPDPLWKQISPLLDEALTQLGEKDRQAVLWRYFEDKSLAEVAGTAGTSEDAARMRISRALNKMHRYFERRGISSTTAMLAGVIPTHSLQAAPVELVKTLTLVAAAKGAAASTHVVLKLTKTRTGHLATTDWIEMGRKDVPMGRVVYDYPSLHLEWNPRDIWNLRVNAAATQMILDHSIHFIQPDPVPLTHTPTPDAVPDPLDEGDFAPRTGANLQGYWKGAIGAGADAVPVNLKISGQADGTFRAEGDDPMHGVYGQPLNVSCHPPTVKMTRASGAGLFQGEINQAGTEISGSWVQGGQSMPARVRRADYQAEHAQDAEQDYTFTSGNDLQEHWRGSWIVSIGKLKVPIRMALNIAKLPKGADSATIANVDQFGQDGPVPASSFPYSPPHLHLEWGWAGGAFEGRLENGKLAGAWFEGGGGFPLVFERTGPR
jgi:RNA polymerase sigma factor (sigma-70 family)